MGFIIDPLVVLYRLYVVVDPDNVMVYEGTFTEMKSIFTKIKNDEMTFLCFCKVDDRWEKYTWRNIDVAENAIARCINYIEFKEDDEDEQNV